MNRVAVRFEGTPGKRYYFNTKLDLLADGFYEIVSDNITHYSNIVYIEEIQKGLSFKNCREITSAKLVKAPPKPEKRYKKIYVNYEKETICIVWRDGTKTIMKPQSGDEFDLEKGIALAFMKKAYNNRSCFNDVFRDIEEV